MPLNTGCQKGQGHSHKNEEPYMPLPCHAIFLLPLTCPLGNHLLAHMTMSRDAVHTEVVIEIAEHK